MTARRFALTLLLTLWLFEFHPVSRPALADPLKDENLLVSPPDGYKVGFEQRKDNQQITEMIPSAETVDTWTEMLTIQVFKGGTDMTPEAFEASVTKLWGESCPGAATFRIAHGAENGYAFSLWMLSCDLNKTSGKPEVAWFKAIQGKDALYVAQRASRFLPDRDQTVAWIRHLKEVRVCDTRLPGSPCG
jgi:hypothetical protein